MTCCKPVYLRTALFLLLLAGSAVGGRSAALHAQGIEPLPEELEIELARSALPEHLRAGATVYVLRPGRGFEVAVPGSNGFHALVVRNDPAFVRGDWPYQAWRNDLLVPIAFDAAGVPAQLRVLLDVAEARAGGASPSELRSLLRRRFADGYYPKPARAGMAYMLSPILRAYRDGGESDAVGTFVYPHYMAYAPDVTSAAVGGGGGPGQPFVIESGPHGYIVIPAGRAEREELVNAYAPMLARLCELREEWCVERDR
ncbi:MAG: hypothetical protein PVF05_09770 [Gemmatimonadales bacterium]|jgi:hypothetical protein